ncbi:tetraspanin-19-like [Macadamia integrifolia]|uniref:tetraspanin-19-like n=1 Tax=Macadamia integrifolia TaxID=60698 RepID=UPI001C52EDFF|nr:tetraspanin-19-like [Macadamia integrifolia]
MGRMLRSCLQSLLKLVNSILGMVGIAIIIYTLWMFRVWQRQIDGSPFVDSNFPTPWFIYVSLGLGIAVCVITFSGHIAAETANGHCLSCYMVFVFLLLMLEAAVAADVFLNSHWEEDFPEDPTGAFDQFKDFVKSNFDFCKWVGLFVVSAQGLSVLLSMVLRALGPDPGRYYDSDDDYAPVRLPLLRNPVQPPPYVVVDPQFAPKNDAWNGRVYDKTIR